MPNAPFCRIIPACKFLITDLFRINTDLCFIVAIKNSLMLLKIIICYNNYYNFHKMLTKLTPIPQESSGGQVN